MSALGFLKSILQMLQDPRISLDSLEVYLNPNLIHAKKVDISEIQYDWMLDIVYNHSEDSIIWFVIME